MKEPDLNILLDKLRGQEGENEWIEFKISNNSPSVIGERISALSNGANLCEQPFGYLIYGIEDKTKRIVGTEKHIGKLKKGNEDLEHWLVQSLEPKLNIKFFDFYRGELRISIIQIPAAINRPTRFRNIA